MTPALRHFIWPVVLLPVFFVLNGYRDNYPLVSTGGALVIFFRYLCYSFLFFGISWLFFRDPRKAALTACALLCIQFFFGSLHDTLKTVTRDGFLSRYIVVVPFLAILLLLFIWRLRRKQWQPLKLIAYVNLLLLVLVVLDGMALVFTARKIAKQPLLKGKQEFVSCPGCPKPDIYFIIADGYPGNEVLDSFFHFSNTAFTGALRERGFHITPRSLSNYNFTMFSMASMLNMDYLEGIKRDYRDPGDIKRCFRAIRQNRLSAFLQSEGYRFFNHSLFDFRGHPSPAGETFIPRAQQLITSQTLTRRLDRDLSFHLYSSLQLENLGRKIMFRHDRTTRDMIRLTEETARTRKGAPKFVYTHLLMPHFPYYYNSRGEPYDWRTLLHFNHDKGRYLEYLQYSNRILLGLIDSIIASSEKPPVIVFGSDHGFRQFTEKVTTDILCSNFSAVLLPGRDYGRFYEGMSSVNQFRAVLNTAFGQSLPMLEDSTIFIMDSEMQ